MWQSFHTSTSESFFPKTSYSPEAFDSEGNFLVSKFSSYTTSNVLGNVTTTWKCSHTLCSTPSKTDINLQITNIYASITKLEPLQARYFVQHMDDCKKNRLHNSTLLGHNEMCYNDPVACGSKLLYLCHLAPHYPNLRRIVNMLYNIRQIDQKLSSLDCALTNGKINDLEEIVKENKQNKNYFDVAEDS